MNPTKIVSRDEWLAARTALLAQEKAFTKQRDAVSAARRMLPWVKVDKRYEFDTPGGKQSLADLFGTESQLILVHFMFGPDWSEGCPSCSFMADTYDENVAHFAHRDVSFVVCSRTALAKIEAYKSRMGWSFPWVSSLGSDFNFDFNVSFDKGAAERGDITYNYVRSTFPAEEAPGVSVFAKDDKGQVFHTYSTFGRGLDILIGTYNYLDLVPKGRDEASLPWSMAWVRRHDQYEGPA